MAEQDVPRGVVGQILGDLFERLVDDLVFVLLDLVRLLIYVVCGRGHTGVERSESAATVRPGFEKNGVRDLEKTRDVHTDDGLRTAGAGRAQPELAQVILGLLGEGVQPCLGALDCFRRRSATSDQTCPRG